MAIDLNLNDLSKRQIQSLVSDYRRVLATDPSNPTLRLALARSLTFLSQSNDAIAIYKDLTLNSRPPTWLLCEYAEELIRLGDYMGALQQTYRLEALDYDPVHERSRILLGALMDGDWSCTKVLVALLERRLNTLSPCVIDTFSILCSVDRNSLHLSMAQSLARKITQHTTGLRIQKNYKSRQRTDGIIRLGYFGGNLGPVDGIPDMRF